MPSSRKWIQEHPEYYRDRHRANPRERLVKSAKRRAKIYGWEFNLTESDIDIPEFCPYLKCKITYDGGRKWSNVSLDRIDSSKGYIKGNVQVVCDLANRMKSEATSEQLLTFARSILEKEIQ